MLAIGVESVEKCAGVVTTVRSPILLSPGRTSMPLECGATAGDHPPLLPPKVLAARWAHVAFLCSMMAMAVC